jgi:hypothetical protein
MEESAEDCYYSIGCYRLGLPTGDEEEDSHFSLHTIFHPQCFGLHQPTKEVKEQLLQFYPEAATAYI